MIHMIKNVKLEDDGWFSIEMVKESGIGDLSNKRVGKTIYNKEMFIDEVKQDLVETDLTKSIIITPIYTNNSSSATFPQKINDEKSSLDYFTQLYKMVNGYAELARKQLAETI